MKRSFKIALALLTLIGIVAFSLFYISTNDIAVLSPKGMIGQKERDLIVTSSLLMLIVVIPVFLLTWFFAWRYRDGNNNRKGKYTPDWEHNYIAEYCWWGVPLIIVGILAVLSWRSSHELNPFKPLDSDVKPIKIQAVALQWKWLFIYPEQGIATVNEVRFPEKTPINFEITADAPMNSFWIPQLGGQIYAMPAMRSKLHLMANHIGTYRGVSSNYSGKGYSGMVFQAKSVSDDEFISWISSVKGSSNRLGMIQYEELVKPSEYDPVSYYVLTDQDLFDQIIMNYLAPPKAK